MVRCCEDCDPLASSSSPPPLYKGHPFLPHLLCCSSLFNDSSLLSTLTTELPPYCAAHSIMMRPSPDTFVHIPSTLLPTPFPRSIYDSLHQMAPLFNLLYHRVSEDWAFLTSSLTETAAVDPFIARLLQCGQRVRRDGGVGQSLHLHINRSDYLLHATGEGGGGFIPQQVEFNTISAGMGCLSTQVAEMHRYLVTRHAPTYTSVDDLPPNPALHSIVEAIATAVSHYERQQLRSPAGEEADNATPGVRAAVLMVVQEGEWNIIDQQLITHTLWSLHSIPTLRRSLTALSSDAHLDDVGQLIIGGHVIAVSYFRAGYTPRDYPTDREWEALYTVERSLSIKCPTVAYHLAGCKRIQQVLSSPAVLQRFLSPDDAAVILPSFTGLWDLSPSSPHTTPLIAAVLADPSSYVLKPQREGGGNNLWGEAMTERLTFATAEELAGYIVMKKIHAPASTTAGVRRGELREMRGVSEMGVFGVWVSEGVGEDEVVSVNSSAGYLMRTKSVGDAEGGISAGKAFLNSVVLV